MTPLFLTAFMAFTVAATGALMAFTPYLMPKSECFTVTIPEPAQRDPRILKLKAGYRRTVLVITVVCVIAALAAGAMGDGSTAHSGAAFDEAAATRTILVLVAATLVPLAAGFALMLRTRKKVMAIKKAEGWAAPVQQQAAALIAEEDIPRAIPFAWNLLYVVVILIVAALGVAWYPLMPEQVPMQANFQGEVTSYASKTGAVFFPLGVDAFMAACMAFSHWTILKSKRPTGIGAPVTSAYAYGMFARAQSIMLIAVGLVLTLVLGVSFMSTAIGLMSLQMAAAIIIFVAVLVVAASIIVSVVYGQAGSRLFARMRAAGTADAPLTMPEDHDEHWKLGVFYFNPNDASLFLPERFGIGWTINFARPAAWALIIAFILLTATFIAVMMMLAA